MELILLGIATAFNFLILKVKLEQGRILDLIFDIAALIALNAMFAGTLGGMAIAMVGSLIISITLFLFPPRIFKRTV